MSTEAQHAFLEAEGAQLQAGEDLAARDDKLISLMEMLGQGADLETCLHAMESCQWDLQLAFDVMTGGGSPHPSGHAAVFPGPAAHAPPHAPDHGVASSPPLEHPLSTCCSRSPCWFAG